MGSSLYHILYPCDKSILEKFKHTYNNYHTGVFSSLMQELAERYIRPTNEAIKSLQHYYKNHNHLAVLEQVLFAIEASDMQSSHQFSDDLHKIDKTAHTEFDHHTSMMDKFENHLIELQTLFSTIDMFKQYLVTHPNAVVEVTMDALDKLLHSIEGLEKTCYKAIGQLSYLQQNNITIINHIHTLLKKA